jgi:hypothetical protein
MMEEVTYNTAESLTTHKEDMHNQTTYMKPQTTIYPNKVQKPPETLIKHDRANERESCPKKNPSQTGR